MVQRFLVEPDEPELPPRVASTVELTGLDRAAPIYCQAMQALRVGDLVAQVDRAVSNVVHRAKT